MIQFHNTEVILKNSNESTSFLDTRTLLAVVLVGVIFVGWQSYMQSKYPDIYNKTAEPTAETPAANPAGAVSSPAGGVASETKASNNSDLGVTSPESSPAIVAAPEKLISYTSETLSFDISSRGMGVKGFKVLRYKTHDGQIIEIGHPEEHLLPFETRLLGRLDPLDFTIETINPNLFVGRARVGGLLITKTMEIHPKDYLIDFKVVASGKDDRFVGLTTALTDEVEPIVSANFLMPQFQRQEFYVHTADSDERVVFGEEDMNKSWNGVKIASLGSQYFTQAIVDNSSVIPEVKGRLNRASKAADLLLHYPVLNRNQDFELSYKAFVGPKAHSRLVSIDDNLAKVVDFGFFNWIGRRILELLNSFYTLVGNWGVAVILLTVVVRLLVLPLNIYSYKSMRVMQVLQPKIQALREKYKDDQAKQQQEMMSLMREHKANPLAGCLPVLLQFPIFLALYQVLGNSIELYQAPFGFWIHDLSLKDPFYVLPVLMGITMFFQQKITPMTTMDPAQAKLLLLMPFIFTFFMASLPSGLTLYMLVGAVFGVVQQMYFMRNTKTEPAVT